MLLCYLTSRPRVIQMVVNEPRVCTLGLKRVDVLLCVCALQSAEMAAHLTQLLLLRLPTHRGFPIWTHYQHTTVVGLELGFLTLPRISSTSELLMVGEVADHKEKGETLNNGWRRDCSFGPRRKVELSNRDFPALVDTPGVQMRFFGTLTIRFIERDRFCGDSEGYEIQTNNRHGL